MVLVVKDLPTNVGDIRDSGSIPGLGRSPGARKCQPTPVFLPGDSHGQRNLAGYSLWGCKESEVTEHSTAQLQLQKHLSLTTQSILFTLKPRDWYLFFRHWSLKAFSSSRDQY